MIDIIILGIIQGIAEFLPISSSAHLIIFRDIFGIGTSIGSNIELTFDLALHFGTLLAIIIFFFNDLFKILVEGLTKGVKTKDGKLFWYLILATIPAGIVGVLFEDIFDSFFRKQLWLIAIALIVMGVIIYLVDKKSKISINIKEMKWYQALVVGCAQVFALIPGFSRSGTTILTGRLMGISKEAVTKFTFLLSVPIIFGATILKVGDLTFSIEVVVGVLTSFVVGVLSIKFLLSYIKKHDFSVFAFYRVILALIVFVKLIFF